MNAAIVKERINSKSEIENELLFYFCILQVKCHKRA